MVKSVNIRVSSDFKQWLDKHSSKKTSKIKITKILADELRGRKYRI